MRLFWERIKKHDWLLNLSVACLFAASLITLSSVARPLFLQQLVWVSVSVVLIAAFSQIDWRPLINYRWIIFWIYAFAIALLVITLLFAPMVRHTRSWLIVGSFRFQTSELAKVALLIMLAYFFTRRHIAIARGGTVFLSFIYFCIPFALVLLQPDWGSALIFLGLWIGFLLLAGIRIRHLGFGFVVLIAVAVWAWFFAFAPYQRERIRGFFEPAYDPLGVNYSVVQSKIAIGSAGVWGKGFGQGTQLQLKFLTEPATDFIFAALVEEWGLIGGFAVIAAFTFLLFRIVRIGLRSTNNFSRFFCLGTVMIFLIHFFLNVGSNIGLVPVVGVPFPLLSYGGSSILTKAMLIGIIQSIAVRALP